ncbi:GNAT family N-acetyltransferase, partial [bacterium]|nr:GNAT family N-acetyltransferase [bacterium]
MRAKLCGARMTSSTGRPKWGVREATTADIPAMNSLFAEVFGGGRPLAHDQWKYGENPFGAPVVVIAEDGNRVIGQYAIWPTPLRLGNSIYWGAQSLDTMTHPDYQGQGMFTALASACYEAAAKQEIVAVYGFPNENSYPGFMRRLNFHHAFDVHGWTRLLLPAAHPRIPRLVAPVASLAVRLFPLPRDAALRFEPLWPEEAATEALLDEWRASPGLCRVERSSAWWRYRFGAASGRKYQCVAA